MGLINYLINILTNINLYICFWNQLQISDFLTLFYIKSGKFFENNIFFIQRSPLWFLTLLADTCWLKVIVPQKKLIPVPVFKKNSKQN